MIITMTRAVSLAGLLSIAGVPAFASETQLAHAAGVAPGLYSAPQLVRLIALRAEGGARHGIERILDDPEVAPLVARLSTSTHGQAGN